MTYDIYDAEGGRRGESCLLGGGGGVGRGGAHGVWTGYGMVSELMKKGARTGDGREEEGRRKGEEKAVVGVRFISSAAGWFSQG